MKYYKYFLLSLGMIVLDQIVKLLVYNTMYIGEEFVVFPGLDFFKIHYTTNPGMAFGWEIGGDYGKLFLTAFRLIAMAGIAWYLIRLAKKDTHPGLLWSIALILGGAVGNLIDSIFYGVLLDGNAIADAPMVWFHGQVIDMFYFDICYCYFPEWVPVFGGQRHALWPIFNIADASIFIGVAIILIWQKRFFKETKEEEAKS